MNKLIRMARTSQSLSLAAMEEASRQGLRDADLEHLFLALVLSDESAGQALRGLGVDIDGARRAVAAQHEAQLAALGIRTGLPEPGRIVFHETGGYEWATRASGLIARAGGKGKAGDAAAVLTELLAEPSGLIADLLDRVGTTADAVRAELVRRESAPSGRAERGDVPKGHASGSAEAFVPAPVGEVWALVSDPARLPEWNPGVATVDDTPGEMVPGAVFTGHPPTHRPDGRPLRIAPKYRRRRIELDAVTPPERIAWRFSYPDAPTRRPMLTALTLAPTTGGTRVVVTMSWERSTGWRLLVGLPLRPLQRFVLWITMAQMGGALSRAFR